MLTLMVEISIDAPIERVWASLVNPVRWWPGVTMAAREGGDFREVWHENGEERYSVGRVLAVSKPTELKVQWQDADWPEPLIFSFRLLDTNLNATEVSLREEGWEIFPTDRRNAIIAAHHQGWKLHLQSLKRAVDVSNQ